MATEFTAKDKDIIEAIMEGKALSLIQGEYAWTKLIVKLTGAIVAAANEAQKNAFMSYVERVQSGEELTMKDIRQLASRPEAVKTSLPDTPKDFLNNLPDLMIKEEPKNFEEIDRTIDEKISRGSSSPRLADYMYPKFPFEFPKSLPLTEDEKEEAQLKTREVTHISPNGVKHTGSMTGCLDCSVERAEGDYKVIIHGSSSGVRHEGYRFGCKDCPPLWGGPEGQRRPLGPEEFTF